MPSEIKMKSKKAMKTKKKLKDRKICEDSYGLKSYVCNLNNVQASNLYDPVCQTKLKGSQEIQDARMEM